MSIVDVGEFGKWFKTGEGGGSGRGAKERGFEGQDGFTAEHEISGLGEETKSDRLA